MQLQARARARKTIAPPQQYVLVDQRERHLPLTAIKVAPNDVPSAEGFRHVAKRKPAALASAVTYFSMCLLIHATGWGHQQFEASPRLERMGQQAPFGRNTDTLLHYDFTSPPDSNFQCLLSPCPPQLIPYYVEYGPAHQLSKQPTHRVCALGLPLTFAPHSSGSGSLWRLRRRRNPSPLCYSTDWA
ncbi:hypothetical protein CPLU01_03791 [Colletotrichum plurivorum]|uniref:Uncharacterized protein n=1 Tax=Colletotrichum plurivorum TaxID=2175906 RepID=A0A8H6KS40_9PEZI|nr:hypothetical protein CPLU01_03791 [Colletotrichum plurivorum]